jgi:hypothetical protein
MRTRNGRCSSRAGLLLLLALVALVSAAAASAAPLRMPLREGQVWRIFAADGSEASRILVARMVPGGMATWCTEDPATLKHGPVATVPVADVRVAILDELVAKGAKADYGFFLSSGRSRFAPAGTLSLPSMATDFAQTLPAAPDEPRRGPERTAARLKAAKDLPARLEAWIAAGVGVRNGKPALKDKVAAWATALAAGSPAAAAAPAAGAGAEAGGAGKMGPGGTPGAMGPGGEANPGGAGKMGPGGPAGGAGKMGAGGMPGMGGPGGAGKMPGMPGGAGKMGPGGGAPSGGTKAAAEGEGEKKSLPLIPIGGGVLLLVVIVALVLVFKRKR